MIRARLGTLAVLRHALGRDIELLGDVSDHPGRGGAQVVGCEAEITQGTY
jgi:hypothetical protein